MCVRFSTYCGAAAADTLTSIATNLALAINSNTSLQTIGVSATSSSTVVNITSTSPNLTTYTKSLSVGATETIALSTGVGEQEAQYNNVNELVNLSPGGDTKFQGVTNNLPRRFRKTKRAPDMGLLSMNDLTTPYNPLKLMRMSVGRAQK